MTFIALKDRVLEHSTSNSQTVFTVTGAIDTSFNAFSASMAVGDWTLGYVAEPGVAFKSGKLTYSNTNEITIDSTFGESKGTFSSSGTKEIAMGMPAKSYAAVKDALAFNNMVVNTGLEVSQENGAATVTLTGTGSLQTKYTVDGVRADYCGTFVATVTQTPNTEFDRLNKNILIQITTAQSSLGANDELSVVIPIEGVRTSRLVWGRSAAQPVALGFWIAAHRAGTYSGSIRNAGKTRSYPFTFTLLTDNPTWVPLIIPGDTSGTWAIDTTVGMYVTICLAGGSSRIGTASAWATADYSGATGTTNGVAATSDSFYLSGVIAFPGIELPAAERSGLMVRSYDEELLLCRRYVRIVENALGIAGDTTLCWFEHNFNPPMRAAPTPTALFTNITISDIYLGSFTASGGTVDTSINMTANGGLFRLSGYTGLTAGRTYALLNAGPAVILKAQL